MDGFDELSEWLEENVFFMDEEDDSEDKIKRAKND